MRRGEGTDGPQMGRGRRRRSPLRRLLRRRLIARLVVTPRRTLLRAFGLDGMSGAQRRFVRFSFLLRGLLLAITPILFEMRGKAAQATPLRWSVFALLVAWFFWVWHRQTAERVRRPTLLCLVDTALAFGAYDLAMHGTASGNGAPSYSTILSVGPFQPQTYGVLITAGATAGAIAGIWTGLFAVGAYVGSLPAIGTTLSEAIDRVHLQAVLLHVVIYLGLALSFGVYSSLIGRLAFSRVLRFRKLVARRVEQKALEERLRAWRDLHDGAIGRFRAARAAIKEAAAQAAADAEGDPARDVELSARLDGIARFVEITINRLAASAKLEGRLPERVDEVVFDVEATEALAYTARHPVRVSLDPEFIWMKESFVLTPEEAHDLREIVSEAIANAKRYAAPGEITVTLSRGSRGLCEVAVIDLGPTLEPPEEEGFGGNGHMNIRARVGARKGWEFEWQQGARPGEPSCLLVRIPRRVELLPEPAQGYVDVADVRGRPFAAAEPGIATAPE